MAAFSYKSFLSQVLIWYHLLIDQLRDFFAIVYVLRVSIVIVIIGAIALIIPEQSLEALRVLAEDGAHKPIPLIMFGVSTLLLSFLAWYWSKLLLRLLLDPDAINSSRSKRGAAIQLPRLCAIAPFLATGIALSNAAKPIENDFTFLTWLALLSLSIALLVYIFFIFGYRQESVKSCSYSPCHFRDFDISTKILLVLTGLLWPFFLLLFCTSAAISIAKIFGSTGVLLLALATLIPLGSLLVYAAKHTRLPWITLFIIAALIFSGFDLNDNHAIRHEKNVQSELPMFNQAFTDWLNKRADLKEYETYPVFLIAAEGGGLRAAYLTAIVLSAIQDYCPRFAQHTFVISGVSGGSLGAATFAGLAAKYTKNVANQKCVWSQQKVGPLQEKAHKVLSHDFLSPLLAAGLYPDLLQRFLPFPVNAFDRALGLELGFERAWTEVTEGDEFSKPFYDLWQDAFTERSIPALFLNTTQVDTGNRMVISNLYPLDERFNRLSSLAGEVDWSMTIPLSTAVGLSARFPLVTPSGYIPIGADSHGRPVDKNRYVDGGYFENSGTATLVDILNAMRVGEDYPSDRPEFKPVIIRIGFAEKFKYKNKGFNEFMSPIRALLNTRNARGVTAFAQLETAITSLQDRGIDIELIEFELKEQDIQLPLGWLLSENARVEIQKQLDKPTRMDIPGQSISWQGVNNSISLGLVIEQLIPYTNGGGVQSE